MAIESAGELLAVRPTDEVMTQIDERFREAVGEDAQLEAVRANRLGRTLFLVADARVPAGRTVEDLDTLRAQIEERMLAHFPHLRMAVVFRALAT